MQVVPLKVHDLDRALAFYTEKVGLEVGMDFTMENGYRWLTVKVPGTEYPEIVLMQAEEGEDISGQMGGFVFHSDDCAATHQELVKRGIEFAEGPTKQMWGIQAHFKDPDGNGHLIVQPTPIPEQ
ncbi:MAG: VOC family protein [Chloroflexi bacterium]|nr:VOC family protein [Chloroflexota bacterium]